VFIEGQKQGKTNSYIHLYALIWHLIFDWYVYTNDLIFVSSDKGNALIFDISYLSLD